MLSLLGRFGCHYTSFCLVLLVRRLCRGTVGNSRLYVAKMVKNGLEGIITTFHVVSTTFLDEIHLGRRFDNILCAITNIQKAAETRNGKR